MNPWQRTRRVVVFSWVLVCSCFSFFNLAWANPGVEVIQPEHYDRVLAISDVHGMYPAALALLQGAQVIRLDGDQIFWNAGKTLLVVIGDSIDKGDQSVEVIDLWMNLQKQAPQVQGRVLHLLGNHEAEFLANPEDKKSAAFHAELIRKKISVQEFTDPAYPRAQFLRAMPLAAKIGSWMFSHSGYFTGSWSDLAAKAVTLFSQGHYSDSFLIGPDSILEAKKWEVTPVLKHSVEANLNANGFVGAVFGHQPDAFGILGSCGTSRNHRLIKIDNGMAPEAGAHAGSILSFGRPSELNGTDAGRLNQISVSEITPDGESHLLVAE